MEKDLIKQGTILISRPTLNNDIFNRSIVLIAEHNEMGTIGFVLNKPTSFQVEDLLEGIPLENIVYEGGPVEQENLFYIHNFNDIEGIVSIDNQLYWSGSLEEIYEKINNSQLNSTHIKFFIGYSGWSPGQLMNEIKDNFWYVINEYNFNPLDIKEVNDWKKQMIQMGGDSVLWANMPENPLLN